MYTVRPYDNALHGHKVALLELADIDAHEARAATGHHSPIMSIFSSIITSKEVCVIIDDDTEAPIGIMGIAEKVGSDNVITGVPWVLGSERFHKINSRDTRSFLNLSRTWVSKWRHQYKYLENFVGANNTKSIRWLEWLGFTVDKGSKWYMYDPDFPFYRFYT